MRVSAKQSLRYVAVYTLAVAMGCHHAALAATVNWDGGGNLPPFNNDNWTNLFNWEGNTIPPNDGTADIVIPNTPRDNPVVDLAWSIDTLTFQGGGTYSLSGQPLTIGGDLTHNGTATATINNTIVVPSSSGATWRAGSGPLVFNGAITGGTSNFVLEAPQPITFGGSAANTFSNTIELDEGTLVLSKSATNIAIVGNLEVSPTSGQTATVRWDASEQISQTAGVTVILQENAVADLNAKLETLDRLTVNGGRVESNGGRLTVASQILMNGVGEIDLGSGELVLPSIVSRSSISNDATSKITASLIRLAQPHTAFNILSTSAAVELEVNGIIADSSAGASTLRKIQNGTLRLLGASTYTGGTIVEDGTLRVDNATGSATGMGPVSVLSGAALTGDGAISGTLNINNGATMSPSGVDGGPLGSLGVGGFTLGPMGTARFHLNESEPVVKNDLLAVTGSAIIEGELVVQNLNNNVVPTTGQTYTLLTSSMLSGAFANVANGARINTIGGTGSFVVNYGAGSPFNPHHVVLSDFQRFFTADFDADGDVDGDDLTVWQGAYGMNALADSDGDGNSDGRDFLAWQRQFGSGVELAASTAVPEPTCLLLFCLGMAAAVLSRHSLLGSAMTSLAASTMIG